MNLRSVARRARHVVLAAPLAVVFAFGVAAAQTTNVEATKVPPLDYHPRELANGLRVYSAVDKTTPNVTVQVWYGVGSKNDPPGRSGFAHLFEHLMFKGARDMPPEYMDRLTEDVGGFNNASTDDDYTEYHEVVPANQLNRLLWAEAERLGGLVVDQANFESERQVVEEELRMRVLADPYGRLFQLGIPEASFALHPYHRPPIGGIKDLDASTLADVRAFHAVYYRPDNASLIVIGNFDPRQLDAWIDRYFAPIPKPATPLPKVTAVEPPRAAASLYNLYGPNVPLPAVVLTFAGPAASSPDAPILRVMDALLSTGKSSRLYEDLVYRQQLADSIFSEADLRNQPGLFAVGAVMAAGKSPEQGETALRAELKRLRETPVSQAELASAKNQLIAGILRNRETLEGRASDLGQAITVEGDPARVNSDIGALSAVSAAQVQAAARRYLVDDRRVTIRYRDESQRPPGDGDALSQDNADVAATPLVPPADIPVTTLAPPDKRQAPPKATAALPIVAPNPVARTLANGLQIVVARTSSLPIVSAQLIVKSGATLDPRGEAGLADVTANLLPQGTTSLSAEQIAARVEALGGSIGADAGHDASSVSLESLSATLSQTLPVLADVVRHPAFATDELERLRQQKLDQLTLAQKDPGSLVAFVMGPAVFGQGPNGHSPAGTPESLKRIGRDDVVAQYARLYRPDNAVLMLTGDITPEAGFALAEQAFGDWAPPAGARPAAAAEAAAPSAHILVVDLPGAGQAAVAVGARSIGRGDPDYYAVEVANAVLGGGYSARLNEEVRVKRGLSYGAGSSVSERRGVGLFMANAQTRNDATPQVVDLMLAEVAKLGAAPPDRAELDARKAALTGTFGRQAATSSGLGGLLAADAVYGVDLDETARYPAAIDAVTAGAARAAAAKLDEAGGLQVVVVGDAKQFIDALRKAHPDLRVIPAARLDLQSPTLEKAAP